MKRLPNVLWLFVLCAWAQAGDKPNVILVMTDDQGYGDLGCHGNPILKTPELDKLLSRGGLMSIMPTVLLLLSGMAFGGILEKAKVLEVLLDSMLKGSHSVLRLISATLASSYIILLGTGSLIQ